MAALNERIFVGIGSNVGDRLALLRRASAMLADHPGVDLLRCSSIFETEPVGWKEQPMFLNAVMELRSSLEPEEFVVLLKELERRIGRTSTVRWGPREIDLDLLLYGQRIVRSSRLTVPHAEISRRRFVLVPLSEIAPEVIEPASGLTLAELLALCPDTSTVLKTSFTLSHKKAE